MLPMTLLATVCIDKIAKNIPTVLFFKDGELKDRSVGLVKLADLEEKLLKLL